MRPSMSLIPSPSSHHISALPAEGESPSPYHLWCLPKPEAQFAITVGPSCDAASCRPQLTVIYKIVLIPPNVLWLSPHFRYCNICISYGIKMSSASVLDHAEDGHRKMGWPPRGHYWGLGQCVCAAFRSHGEITSSSGAGSEQPRCTLLKSSKIPSLDFHYQTCVQ